MPPMANPVAARDQEQVRRAARLAGKDQRLDDLSDVAAACRRRLIGGARRLRHGADRDREAEPPGGVADLERARRQSRRGFDDAGHWLSSVTLRQPTVPSALSPCSSALSAKPPSSPSIR